MHALARIFAGFCFLLAPLLHFSLPMATIQLLLMGLVIAFLLGASSALLSSVRLLAWLVAPTMILHALFSPGEFLIPGIPVTKEGMTAGIRFSLHLTVIFIAAVQFSRLLTRQEWYSLICAMPYFGEKMAPYVLLVDYSGERVRKVVADALKHWKGSGGGVAGLPDELLLLPNRVLDMSRQHAESIWESWEQRMERIEHAANVATVSVPASLLAVVIGGLMLWLDYFEGH